MARITGVELPKNKRIEIALTYIHGIGKTTAQDILKLANIDKSTRTDDLSTDQVKQLNSVIEKNYKVEGELKQEVFRNIKRLKDIRAYRGIRHKLGLPVRGQNTRTNAVTRKGRNQAVGGLKIKLTQK